MITIKVNRIRIRRLRIHILRKRIPIHKVNKRMQGKQRSLQKELSNLGMIVHPCFLNISEDETIKFLADKEPRESIIHPSLKGPTHLILTLKIFNGVYAHKDIVEGGKDQKDFASYLRLEKVLSIGEETFEDLDEVIDRYIFKRG